MRNQYRSKLEYFYGEHNRMPTYREMMELFGFKSKNAVYKVVGKLVDAGTVAQDHLGRLVPTDSFAENLTSIPKLGLVTAGFPASVEEELADTVDLDEMLIKNKPLTYMLEVDGDSMIDAHIEDGDMVLVEKCSTARDGEIVIAEVDGEFTMKYLRRQGSTVWLEPANENYQPIHPTHSLNVIAVLKAVIRKY
jgi:SOS regulatory protein LexA